MKPSHKRPELPKTLAHKWTSLKKCVCVALGVSHLENDFGWAMLISIPTKTFEVIQWTDCVLHPPTGYIFSPGFGLRVTQNIGGHQG